MGFIQDRYRYLDSFILGLLPILLSAPANKRCILPLCLYTAMAATISKAPITCVDMMTPPKMGLQLIATSAAKDEYLNKAAINNHIRTKPSPSSQDNANKPPIAVAIPFPPLKP